MKGIALGPLLFYVITLGILGAHFLKKNNSPRASLYFSLKMLKKMLRYSIIRSSEYLFNGLYILALSVLVSARFETEYLILVSVVNLWYVDQIIPEGVGKVN